MRLRALFASSLVLAAGVASAQGVDDPEAALRRGVELRVERRDAEALALFERVWTLSRTPRARAQMGWAEQALGRWVDAEAHLAEALASPDDPWVVANAAALESSLREVRRRVGSLEVLGTPDGAHVEVDGREVGTLPLPSPVRVAAGTVTLRVWAEGCAPLVREGVRVMVDALARESVYLAPRPAPRAREAPPPTAPAGPVGGAPRPSSTPGASSTARVVAWTGVGVGALSLGVAAVAWGLRTAAVDRYNAGHPARCLGTSFSLAEETDAECRSDREAASTWQAVGVATTVAGPLLIGAGVTLMLLAPRAAPANVSVACAPGFGSVGCALRF